VRVITGKDKGKEGVIDRVLLSDNKVIVTGVNIAAKHQRARRANDKSGIIDKDMPMDASNVMFVHKGKTVRLGYQVNKKGDKIRIARPSGDEV
jgi:large subunit ribosomal protein L24